MPVSLGGMVGGDGVTKEKRFDWVSLLRVFVNLIVMPAIVGLLFVVLSVAVAMLLTIFINTAGEQIIAHPPYTGAAERLPAWSDVINGAARGYGLGTEVCMGGLVLIALLGLLLIVAIAAARRDVRLCAALSDHVALSMWAWFAVGVEACVFTTMQVVLNSPYSPSGLDASWVYTVVYAVTVMYAGWHAVYAVYAGIRGAV